MNDWLLATIAFAVGALVCRVVTGRALRNPPERLLRTNVDGRPVPAVLGRALVAGVLAGGLVWVIHQYREVLAARCLGADLGPGQLCPFALSFVWRPWLAFALLTLGMFALGLWDDLKGDERPRGFRGHLASIRTGVVTGGILKLVGGTVTGIVTAALVGFPGVLGVLLAALCIALSANAINLFDRAPGRASKVFLIVAVPLVVFRPTSLWLAATIGGVCATLPYDLKARGMLGDAGANPMGAILGLALAMTTYYTSGLAFLTLLVVLLVLNLASEKVSFSEVIANNRVLARLDHLGRE